MSRDHDGIVGLFILDCVTSILGTSHMAHGLGLASIHYIGGLPEISPGSRVPAGKTHETHQRAVHIVHCLGR